MKRITLICLMTLFAAALSAHPQNADSLNNELAVAEQQDDKIMAAKINNMLGGIYVAKGIYDTALFYFEKSIEWAKAAKSDDREATAMLNIADSYAKQGKYAIAINRYMNLLRLYEHQTDNNIDIFTCVLYALGNIAEIHVELNNLDRASYYIEKARKIAEEAQHQGALMQADYVQGIIHLKRGEFDKAKEKIIAAMDALIYYPTYVCYFTQALAAIHIAHKEYDKAQEYAAECMKNAEMVGDPKLLSKAWSVYSDICRAQRMYEDCAACAAKGWEIDSLDLATGAKLTFNIAWANLFLNNKEKSVTFFEKYSEIVKRQTDENAHENLMTMEIQYDTEKKEMRISSLEKEKTLYTWLIIVGSSTVLLAFGMLFFSHRLNLQKRKQAEQQVKQLEQEKQLVATQAVLDGETAERSRLARDLHDGLGGMLSVVKLNLKDMKGYTILDNYDATRFDKALEMLDQSIGELRRVAHHIMPESLMRNGLKVSLEDFCRAIPCAQFQYFGGNPRLDSRLEVLIYRCAYELINNAVKHANATNINVQLLIDNGLISLSVHDNGTGFDTEKVVSGSGLENLRV
ncbi:MAG: tetratricopeptide repeat protein, partial [Prevotellaceae bacterium]|nr:tetratricopeptide repeat protein [Prevotellaceae bacterium]